MKSTLRATFVLAIGLMWGGSPVPSLGQGCPLPLIMPDEPIQLSSDATHKAEVAISVDPSNPLMQVIAGSREGRLVSYYTCNGGKTWTEVPLPIPAGRRFANAIAWSDPSVGHDQFGNVYVAYNLREGGRSDPESCAAGCRDAVVVARSTNGGATYTPVLVSQWADEDVDKPFLVVDNDRRSPGVGNVYVAWTDFLPGQMGLYLATSTDRGLTWTTQQLHDDDDIAVDLGIGPGGEVYTVWRGADEILFEHCGVAASDCGSSAADSRVASTATFSGLPAPVIPALGQNDRLLQLPTIDVDRSGGPRNGRLWVAFADYANTGEVNKIDIFVTWSDDHGDTWRSPAVQINIDNTVTSQFHPWLSVDQSDGSVGVVYYSTQGDPVANKAVDVYYAQFHDGAAHLQSNWTNRRVSRVSSAPTISPMGNVWYREYIGLQEHANVGYMTWVAFTGGYFQVHYAQMPGYLTEAHAGLAGADLDHFGHSLARGDFDDDGRNDLAVGVPGRTLSGVNSAGAVVVYYGGEMQGPRPPQVLQFGGRKGIGDHFGTALAAGDFNADGIDDLAVGSPGADIARALNSGAVDVFFGSASGLQTGGALRLTQTQAGASEEEGDGFGWSLASGDFDSDGAADLAVGVPFENVSGQTDSGMAVVYYGDGSSPLAGSSAQRWGQSQADQVAEAHDQLGFALVAADFDADGQDDLALGVPGQRVNNLAGAGMVIAYYGTAAGLRSMRAQHWYHPQALLGGPAAGDGFGAALAAGNVDGSGGQDLAIGTPSKDVVINGTSVQDVGSVVILYGASSAGLESFGYDIRVGYSAGDTLGFSVASGDFNGDGTDDLAIGVPGVDANGTDNAGSVHVHFGSASGLRSRRQIVTQTLDGGIAERFDRFGSSLAAGDFDGNGKSDLAVGTPQEDVGGVLGVGTVYLYRGFSAGLIR